MHFKVRMRRIYQDDLGGNVLTLTLICQALNYPCQFRKVMQRE